MQKKAIYMRRRILVCVIFLAFITLFIILVGNLFRHEDKNQPANASNIIENENTADIFEKKEITVSAGENIDIGFQAKCEATYKSENESIAVVDKNGIVTGVSAGETRIIAESNGGKKDYLTIKVSGSAGAVTSGSAATSEATSTDTSTTTKKNEVTEIKLSTDNVIILKGNSKMPIVTMIPETAKDKGEKWSSDNEKVATVNEHGNIKGVGVGKCTVTVTSTDNPAVSAKVSVTVTEKEVSSGVTYIDGILVVNKTYSLPSSYNPDGIELIASSAFKEMQTAALEDGIKLWIQSGFRSYSRQQSIYENNVAKFGVKKTDTFSARAGYSEHQSGLAFDINVINDSFAGTPEAEWAAKNCYKFGFILRYPKGKEDITGYKYEPWHFRYVGAEKAEEISRLGLCLEEYLNITSVYADN